MTTEQDILQAFHIEDVADKLGKYFSGHIVALQLRAIFVTAELDTPESHWYDSSRFSVDAPICNTPISQAANPGIIAFKKKGLSGISVDRENNASMK